MGDTWKKCSDCPIDGLEHDGKVYQCHSDALGFEDQRCCGIAPECSAAEAQSDFMCASLEYYECQWIDHRDCPELKVSQIRAASPTGCCETTVKETGEDMFDDDVHEVDCGGEFTEKADKKKLHFLFHEDRTCADVQEEYRQAEIAAAEAEAEAEAEEEVAPERRLAAAKKERARELYMDRYSDIRPVSHHHRRRV